MNNLTTAQDKVAAKSDIRLQSLAAAIEAHGKYRFRCYDKDGNLKWEDTIENTVVNTGLDEILDKVWKGSGYTAAHYVGLTDSTPTVAAGDTMASHAGWAEDQNYSQAARPALTANLGSVSGQSLATSTSLTFSINATTTIGGAFVTTVSTKGGTTGILMSAGAFTQGDRSVANGDTLNVDITFTAS